MVFVIYNKSIISSSLGDSMSTLVFIGKWREKDFLANKNEASLFDNISLLAEAFDSWPK